MRYTDTGWAISKVPLSKIIAMKLQIVKRSGSSEKKEKILEFFLMYQCYLKSLHIAFKSHEIITLKMRLTKEERVKIVELHFQNNGSVVSVQRISGNDTSPSKKCIKSLVLATEDKPRCGTPRSIRTDASIQRVAASVADNTKTSTRRRCFQLGMMRDYLCNISTIKKVKIVF